MLGSALTIALSLRFTSQRRPLCAGLISAKGE
jgi:hypothetical protein